MVGWFNLVSLVLGGMAWILPVISMLKYEDHFKRWAAFSMISLMACSAALFFQIFSLYERVKAEDWAALLDTMSFIVSVSVILLIGTILLNVITINMYRKKQFLPSYNSKNERG
ncbi:hypothetical protein M3210_08520 [Oceanobacillus luteolus]|uniref:hypothetical protein n=1 Tax=Oceanobacillus luteolus TaxID=1274358 RepID=UPI00203F43E4|nr:hypothetical protein [Oceanobacillus luteolus]